MYFLLNSALEVACLNVDHILFEVSEMDRNGRGQSVHTLSKNVFMVAKARFQFIFCTVSQRLAKQFVYTEEAVGPYLCIFVGNGHMGTFSQPFYPHLLFFSKKETKTFRGSHIGYFEKHDLFRKKKAQKNIWPYP